jgi:cytosine/uracil/thiamine/allantoin permease
MKAINAIVSNVIPPLVNSPDLTRYAKSPRDTLPLPIGIILSKPLVVFLGMVITAAGYKQFGEVISIHLTMLASGTCDTNLQNRHIGICGISIPVS